MAVGGRHHILPLEVPRDEALEAGLLAAERIDDVVADDAAHGAALAFGARSHLSNEQRAEITLCPAAIRKGRER